MSVVLVLGALLLALLPGQPALARQREPHPSGPNLPALSSFIDRYVLQAMKVDSVPGAAVVVVEDGRIIFRKGYGYANVASKRGVDPNRTSFRVASLSKVFTATAVMQLVERHKLQLDRDVNLYLHQFKVPNTFPEPVTLADLLTHTSGFDDRSLGQYTDSSVDPHSLGKYLADRLPPRVLPPGAIYSYSNWNTALAGYIVESVSHMTFSQYMQRRLLDPLGMRHSTFQQPVQTDLQPDLATGYDTSSGLPQKTPPRYFKLTPAGALSTTASDMAHFMIAQLEDGRYSSTALLQPRTLHVMQALHFRASRDADLNGMAYGFERYRRHGQVILSKDGENAGFAAYLSLFPAHRLGLFFAGNTSDNGWMREFERLFVDHYFPVRRSAQPVTPVPLRRSLSQFTGSYWSNDYSRTTIEKLRQLTRQLQINDNGDGSITVHYWDGSQIRMTRIKTLGFESVVQNDAFHWAFLRDKSGHIAHFLDGNDVYDRINWYETTTMQEAFIVAFGLIFLSGVLVLIVVPIVQHGTRSRGSSQVCKTWTLARAVGGLSSGMNAVFLVGLLAIFKNAAQHAEQDYSWIQTGAPPILYGLLAIPLLTTALAITLPIFALAVWCRSSWRVPATWHYTAVTLSALAFIPFLRYWNLLGYHL